MELNNKLFFEAINEIAERNLLEKNELNKIIKNAFFKTFHSKIDPDAELELLIDPKNKRFQLINHSKLVVSDEEYDQKYSSSEISLSKAKKINKDIKTGGKISQEVDLVKNKKFSAQVRQLITQNVREKRKKAVYVKHKLLKGEMIKVEVVSIGKNGYVIFKLEDDTMAFMPAKLRNQNIKLKIGEKVKVYVEDVLEESKDSQIIVSNGSPTLIKRIIEANVPEVEEGIVEIVNISRIAGFRSKVAVKSNNENVDPVGAIIGANGRRIKKIIEKLENEKLDIILWKSNLEEYICNTLSPSRVISILEKKDSSNNVISGQKTIVTPNIHQTLAIGKNGLNVRLAVELTNTRLDIISYDQAKEKGIEIIWNGNVKEEELANIEANIKTQKSNFKKRFNNKFEYKKADFKEISSFYENMNNTQEEIENNSFNDNNDVNLSNEELEQLSSNFDLDELDSELLNFGSEKKSNNKKS